MKRGRALLHVEWATPAHSGPSASEPLPADSVGTFQRRRTVSYLRHMKRLSPEDLDMAAVRLEEIQLETVYKI